MGREIERRFLVNGEGWRQPDRATPFRQGFLSTVRERVVRVRLAGGQATLTIKGPARESGFTRPEFEYPIPAADAEYLLDHLCHQPLIEKTRYRIPWQGLIWEVDEFFGENQGLVVAEVELKTEDQAVVLPPWVAMEITHDHRYSNANLVMHPFTRW
ncbi:MAG: CYTH domain-containing protein [Magnetococcales bacterium]|nr:CYTH domain-containing protein [Magnetococcales bacterium]